MYNKFFTPLLFVLLTQILNAQKLAVVPYVSGINSPIDVKHCGDDRMFVADRGGLIRVVNADGTLRPTPFLDISSKVHQAEEDGLLGLAFSPNYKTDGKFYINYIDSIAGVISTVIEEYKVSSSDSNIANPSSALTIIKQTQPFDNHVGGNLMFANGNYLYINFGDGDQDGDPNNYCQDVTTFLGKILRIDVSNSSPGLPYSIPSANPFYNNATPGIKKEIWALGVRNPWRSSVDKITGDLWIADVGQAAHEEIDFQPANSTGSMNYGWPIMEGSNCYRPATGCSSAGVTLPIYDYPHPFGNAVIGGYVSRTAQSKLLFGTYIFGDFASKWIDGIQQSGGVMSGGINHLITASNATGNPISFGEDRFGDQYIIFDNNQTVYKLQDTSYLLRPKAYFTPLSQGSGSYLLQGLEGRGLTYQWLRNNTVIPGATSTNYSSSAAGSYTLVVTNSLSFSDTSDIYLIGAVLPLKIVSFNAQRKPSNNIQLQWETASEQNVLEFSVLRKQSDEGAFSSIGYVQTKSLNGISNSELDYSFIDSSALANSKIFYRLKITHVDGSLSYSDVITITSSANSGFEIYPNPASGYFQIDINEFVRPSIVIIYDLTGRKIHQQILNQPSTKIEIKGLKGVYFVQTSNADGSGMVRKKLLVK
jgi:glucose/arabinose dehydrogenase